jgi:1-acyl-sn-glycerol-3-phosphate acyltransferase
VHLTSDIESAATLEASAAAAPKKQLKHQALVALAAGIATAFSLELPELSPPFLATLAGVALALWWGLGGIEPLLVAVGSAGAGGLWAERIDGLVAFAHAPSWSAIGFLSGLVVAAFGIQGRLEQYRGQEGRALGSVWATAGVVFAAALAFARQGSGAALAMLLPTVSAFLLVPVGMNILFLRGRTGGAPRLLHLLGGLWVFAFLFFVQVALFSLVEPALWLVGRDRAARTRTLRALSKHAMRALFMRFPYGRAELVNVTAEAFRRPSIIVSNHQSAVDIPMILSLPGDARLTLKKRVWDAPYMGIGARRLGHILVEPETPEKTLERCRAVLDEGASVHFFPEGTRGTDIYPRRFHRGAFDVAIELGRDVIPVVLCDSRICLPRDAYWIEPFHMVMKALPPVTPQNFDYGAGPRELSRHVQTLVREELVREMRRLNTPAVLRRKVRRFYRYFGRAVERGVERELRALETSQLYALPEEGLVLDLTCGLGVRVNWLREKHPVLRVRGYEADAERLRIARATNVGTERVEYTGDEPSRWDFPPADGAILGSAELAGVLPRLALALRPGAPLVVMEVTPALESALLAAGFRPRQPGLYARGPSA